MVNTREQTSWVHRHDPKAATEKAKILVRMAVAKANFLEAEEEPEIDIMPVSLVVGAGISGLTASLSLADQGFQVYLVEKELEVGGVLRDLGELYPTRQNSEEFLLPLIDAVKKNERIKLFTSSTVVDVKGFIGNFDIKVSKEDGETIDFKVGTIIVATGAEPFKPEGYYEYGLNENVVTQLELEQCLKELEAEFESGQKRMVDLEAQPAREQ